MKPGSKIVMVWDQLNLLKFWKKINSNAGTYKTYLFMRDSKFFNYKIVCASCNEAEMLEYGNHFRFISLFKGYGELELRYFINNQLDGKISDDLKKEIYSAELIEKIKIKTNSLPHYVN